MVNIFCWSKWNSMLKWFQPRLNLNFLCFFSPYYTWSRIIKARDKINKIEKLLSSSFWSTPFHHFIATGLFRRWRVAGDGWNQLLQIVRQTKIKKNKKWKSLKKESADNLEDNLLQSGINMAELRGYY